MLTWRLILRYLRRHPGRSTLTLLSIAIGVASVIAVSLGTATTQQAYHRMYEEIAGRAALQVTAPANVTFPQEVTEKIAAVPGVRSAVPSYQRIWQIDFEGKWLYLTVIGVDPQRDSDARDYELREGRFLTSDDRASGLLEAEFAAGAGIHVGERVKFLSAKVHKPGHLGSVTIVGLLAARGPAGFNQGGVLFLPLGFAQRYLGEPGKINVIDVVLTGSTDADHAAPAVRAAVPPGLDVHSPAAATPLAKGTTTEIQWGLSLASVFAVVLAFIIIVNTFLMNAAERRPQFAVLRAVGATRRQVAGIMVCEALLLGILGTLLGCLLGLAGGYLLTAAVTRLYVTAPPPVVFSPLPFVLAIVAGPLLSLLAAAVPAWLTTRVTPVEAMQSVVAREGAGGPRWMLLCGGGLLVVVAGGLVASIFGWLPSWFSIVLGALAVALFVLVIPALVRPLAACAGWLLRPLGAAHVRLAARQVVRRPVRSALTIGVVHVATAIGIGLGSVITTTISDVRTWHNQTLQGDFFLRTAFPNNATGESVLAPDGLEKEIRSIPGVKSVDTVRFFNTRAGGRPVVVVSREFPDPEPPIVLYHADPRDVRRRLLQSETVIGARLAEKLLTIFVTKIATGPGEAMIGTRLAEQSLLPVAVTATWPGDVVIGTRLAQQLHVNAGGEIEVDTARHGRQKFRVAALAIDYMVGGEIMFVARMTAERRFDVEGVNTVAVTAWPKDLDAVHAALERIARRERLMLHSFAALGRMIDRMMGGVIGGLWAILALGFVVAAFGIANTLTMSVAEQTRELALLRVVAMTRWQVRRLVLCQAGIIGLVGLGLGIVAGVATAYAISLSLMPLLGYPLAFPWHPWLVSACFGCGLALVLVAALVPAERAARLDLLIALQYE